jgi:hypothetical protein
VLVASAARKQEVEVSLAGEYRLTLPERHTKQDLKQLIKARFSLCACCEVPTEL